MAHKSADAIALRQSPPEGAFPTGLWHNSVCNAYTPVVQEVCPWIEAKQVQELLASRGVFGKLVMEVR